jgi:hypothetical protein
MKQRKEMKNSKATVSVLILFAISIMGVNAQTRAKPYRVSDTELDQLIGRIEIGGDALRSSLTDAFGLTPYDRTRSEGSMNDAVRLFKSATNQLRHHFDTRQLVTGDIERLIGRATPLERFMRNSQLTDHAQSDWSTVRAELTVLAKAYDVDTFWGNTPSSQTCSQQK